MGEKQTANRIIVPAMLADTDYLFRQAKEGAEAFQTARPFPHLLLSSLIKPSCCIALHEGLQAAGGHGVSNPLPAASIYTQQLWPPVLRHLLWELSSSTLLRHFASLTGTPPLLPDPFLTHGGIQRWERPVTAHRSEQEYFPRHPVTDLQNILRFELFVSSEASGTFTIELTGSREEVLATQIGSNGCVLFTGSDHYQLRYRCEKPENWRSLIAYFYINDRARCLNGEEQPRATY